MYLFHAYTEIQARKAGTPYMVPYYTNRNEE